MQPPPLSRLGPRQLTPDPIPTFSSNFTLPSSYSPLRPTPLVLLFVLSSNPPSSAVSYPTPNQDSSALVLLKALAGELSPGSRLLRARRGGFARRPGLRLEMWRLHGALRFRVPGRCTAVGIFSARRPSRLGFSRFCRDQRSAALCRSGRRNFGTIPSSLTIDVSA